jgi:hypothetical protein
MTISGSGPEPKEDAMANAQEKRSSPRDVIKASAVYFPFTSLSTYSCDATVLNSSDEGMYFESRYPLKPGQCICIRTKHVLDEMPVSSDAGGPKTLSLAQVRWCEPKQDARFIEYGVGVKYV